MVTTWRTVSPEACSNLPQSMPLRDRPRFTNFSSSSTRTARLLLADGADGDDQLVLLDGGVGSLEVEPLAHLALGLVHRVAQFLTVDLGDNIE